MSWSDIPESRKRLLTPPSPHDRVKRLKTTKGQQNSLHISFFEENEDTNRLTDPAPQQARKPIAKMFCGSCYDLGAPVRLEIRSARELRFQGTHASLLATLNNLPILKSSLSKQTRS